ncbi:MAG: DUF2786 domain-containing protein [Planctomycetes bacterium]|nr:DUF2786 domain-containing protein [Planctomycetota bacterium]
MDSAAVIAATRELYRFFGLYNREYLDGALRRPVLRIVDSSAVLGAWHATTREIRMAAHHVGGDPWCEVCGTLRHEMAHQYADEVLHAGGEPPHGPGFRRACRLLRVEPTPHGGDDAAREETSRLVSRVHKLFALGRSPNEHEAESAMRKARELVAEHELRDLRDARRRDYAMRQLGDVKKRHMRWEHVLAGLLGEFFCVEPIWAPSYDVASGRAGSVLHIHGAERNLLLAEHVFVCLTRMLEPLWCEHRSRRRLRGDRERQRYWEGLLTGFQERLRARDRELPAARELHAIRVRDGDPGLRAHFRWHNPRIRSLRIGISADSETWAHGREDGRAISIDPPITAGESGRRDGGIAGVLPG